MKTSTSILLMSIGFAASALSGCAGMSIPFVSTPAPTVAQPGDEKLTCAQLAQESNKLRTRIRDLDSSRKVASTAQASTQLAEQAGQLASMTGGRGESALPLAGAIGQVASSGAAASAANLETSYQAAIMRKEHVDRLAANKNCTRK